MESLEIAICTSARREAIDITERVLALAAGTSAGALLLTTPHTTAALLLSELDEQLRGDLLRAAEHLLENAHPFSHRRNDNPNAEAHILSAFIGSSVMLPIVRGAVLLGTYRRIILLELDGPKERKFRCCFLG